MEERKDLSEGAANVLKVVVLLAFLGGAVFFGKKVWEIEFQQNWKRWTAIVLGEFSYLYSFVFYAGGIASVIVYFRDKEENGWGLRGGFILLAIATIFQLVFWGIVFAVEDAFEIAMWLLVAVIIVGIWLKKRP